MPDPNEPFGYSIYKQLLQMRVGEDAAILSPEVYGQEPLKAFEIALGLQPRQESVVGKMRKSREEARAAADLTESKLRERTGY